MFGTRGVAIACNLVEQKWNISTPHLRTYKKERGKKGKDSNLLSNAWPIPGIKAVPPMTKTAWRYLRILSSPPAARALLNIATSNGNLLASKHTSIVYPPAYVDDGVVMWLFCAKVDGIC